MNQRRRRRECSQRRLGMDQGDMWLLTESDQADSGQ